MQLYPDRSITWSAGQCCFYFRGSTGRHWSVRRTCHAADGVKHAGFVAFPAKNPYSMPSKNSVRICASCWTVQRTDALRTIAGHAACGSSIRECGNRCAFHVFLFDWNGTSDVDIRAGGRHTASEMALQNATGRKLPDFSLFCIYDSE
mgnify:CR=1 FL=1